MLRFTLALLGIAASLAVSPARGADKATGTVVAMRLPCDHFLVATKNGFDVLERYHGRMPKRGDVLIGPYENTTGIHTIVDRTAHFSVRVFVEVQLYYPDEAVQALNEKCD